MTISPSPKDGKMDGGWYVDDFGQPDYLDGIKAQFCIIKGEGHPVAYAFRKEEAALLAEAPDLLAFCEIFLGGDERFQIAVGGNPIAVNNMLADARAAIHRARSTDGGGDND